MKKFSKGKIIDIYHRLVKEHAGVVIGERVFKKETGISHHYWKGGYWRSWSAFQTEAGFTPNTAVEKISDEILLQRYAELALERNVIPSEADIMLKKQQDSSFPSKSAYRRWGSRQALLAKVTEYCDGKKQFEAVLDLLSEGISTQLDRHLESCQVKGFIYLLQAGKNYKLGRTNAIGRRLRELSIQLPQKPNVVHVIETDDPEGIEQYWHRRFQDKRQGGEWFSLSAEDVKAFKRRKYQ